MKMSNEMYDFLTTLAGVILPSFAAFYKTLAEIWGLPFAEQIPPTLMAIVVFMNSYLNKSSKAYYQRLAQMTREAEGTLDVEDVEHSFGAENDSEQG